MNTNALQCGSHKFFKQKIKVKIEQLHHVDNITNSKNINPTISGTKFEMVDVPDRNFDSMMSGK